MALLESIILVILIILGIAVFGFWLFFDRRISWPFALTVILYIPLAIHYKARDWVSFSTIAILFLVTAHVYGYDKYFSHYKAAKRGRR